MISLINIKTPSFLHNVLLAKARTDNRKRKEGFISPNVIKAIKLCIENRYLLNFYYTGDHENPGGRRYAQVHVWGLSRFTGNNLIRAYQYAGKTTTIEPGFKTFRLDRISSTAPLKTRFNKPAPLYNPDGDSDMSLIFMKVRFDEEIIEPTPIENPKNPIPEPKNEIGPDDIFPLFPVLPIRPGGRKTPPSGSASGSILFR